MAIEFRCPNGHRLSCPDDRAGKPAKCPKCNATFTVPTSEAAAAAAVPGSGVSLSAVADSGSISSIGKGGKIEAASEQGGSPPGNVIVFLCPNGHKLNCPPSMQGKAGKCPHCGAKFLIPQYGAEEALEDQAAMEEEGEPQSEADIELEMAEEPQLRASTPSATSPPELPFDFSVGLGGTPEPSSILPGIFNELWMHHDQTLVIEVQLRSGATITPHHYSPNSSREGYAIFAVKEPHGAYTLSVVAWDQIERITVRGMSELPPEYFP
jgi:hypothetical protein